MDEWELVLLKTFSESELSTLKLFSEWKEESD